MQNNQQNNDGPFTRRVMHWRALLKMGRDLTNRHYTSAETSRFIKALLKTTKQPAPRFAADIGVAPQTVNRWLRGTVSPRVGQLQKIVALMENGMQKRPLSEAFKNLLDKGSDHASQAFQSLGLHFSDSIMALESQARDVWIIKCGVLREAARGFMGEKVLQALKQGTNFHYVFLPDSGAERTFRCSLQPWLEREHFLGSVTGYIIKDAEQAATLGITRTPGAWIAIEYSNAQMQQLHRGFDVFKALPVREYSDATRQNVKNEDGQPCWIELATPQASVLMSQLNDLRSNALRAQEKIENSDSEIVEIISVKSRVAHD